MTDSRHIVLFGFRHTGKTAVGKHLAARLNRPFWDLDHEIELAQRRTCRDIASLQGIDAFRAIESQMLASLLHRESSAVIALGGGALITLENQALVMPYVRVHLTAAPETVLKRIQHAGWPVVFGDTENQSVKFQELWDARQPVFERLAQQTVANNDTPAQAAETIATWYELHHH